MVRRGCGPIRTRPSQTSSSRNARISFSWARTVADDEHHELGGVTARFGKHAEAGAGLGADAATQVGGDSRPPAAPRVGEGRGPEVDPETRIDGDLDRLPGRDALGVHEQRHATALTRVKPDERLLEADRGGWR